MIPRDYITELVQRSDIVDVVQSYVQLRHRGRTHTGLCQKPVSKARSLLRMMVP